MHRTLGLSALALFSVAGGLAACSGSESSNGQSGVGGSDASAGSPATGGAGGSGNSGGTGASTTGGSGATAGSGGTTTGGQGGSSTTGGSAGNGGATGGSGGSGGSGVDVRVDCDGDGVPDSVLGTLSDCAACGDECTATNGTADCVAGACVVTGCDSGWDDCDGNVANGCEADLNTSVLTCGSCTTACDVSAPPPVGDGGVNAGDAGSAGDGGAPPPTTTSFVCVQGLCQITDCPAGYDDCDSNPDNGCETNLSTLANCGACGNPCSVLNGEASCSGGTCHVACAGDATTCAATARQCDLGYGDCNGVGSDGCETPTNTKGSCGGCGLGCDFLNAGEACALNTAGDAYVCNYLGCDPGYADCDTNAPTVAIDGDDRGGPVDACETSLAGTGTPALITDCGACGTDCAVAAATNVCEPLGGGAYQCAVSGCTGNTYDDPNVQGADCSCSLTPGGHASCAAAATNFNVVSLGGNVVSVSGNMPDRADDWHLFAFDQDGTVPGAASTVAGRNSATSRRDGNTSVTHSLTIDITAGYTFQVYEGNAGAACGTFDFGNIASSGTITCASASGVFTSYSQSDPCNVAKATRTASHPATDPAVPARAECTSETFTAPDLIWVRVLPPVPQTCAPYTLDVEWD